VYRFWSLLFAAVPIVSVIFCLISPDMGWWFPENIGAPVAHQIDGLFNTILAITGLTFIGCNALLVGFMWRYAEKGAGDRGIYNHGIHAIERAGLIGTTVILAYVAWTQIPVWEEAKFRSSMDKIPLQARVIARQFEWRMVYPGPDQTFDTADDFESNSVLAVPEGADIKIELSSMDVLHSFFLPHMRIKQDAVPGLIIPVWFQANKVGTYPLVCAELCGWGHYKMKGQIEVLKRADYDEWLETMAEASQAAAEEAD
jgi:cytochrome c oxidase subunit II